MKTSMVANIEPESELRGSIGDGKVRGLGISNMKGGVAAFMMAGKALKKSGVRLKGDVVFAAVVGEISRTPIGPWQTKEYRGEGVGTRHLLTHGMHTDYAVVADGSDLNIVWTQTGVVQIKITTFGKAEAAWGSRRSNSGPSGSRNNISTIRPLARFIPRSTSAPSKAARPTGPIIFPEFAASA